MERRYGLRQAGSTVKHITSREAIRITCQPTKTSADISAEISTRQYKRGYSHLRHREVDHHVCNFTPILWRQMTAVDDRLMELSIETS
jgi:hypothetical protein